MMINLPKPKIARLASASNAFAVAAALTCTSLASASMGEIVQTGTYAEVSIGADYDESQTYEPNHYYGSSNPVEGLLKFDPSLGQLREVRVSTEFNFQYDYGFNAQGILNTSTGSSYSASFSLQNFGGAIHVAPKEKPGWRYYAGGYGTGDISLMEDGVVGAGDGETSDGRNESGIIPSDYTLDFGDYAMNNFIQANPADTALIALEANVDVPTTAQFSLFNLAAIYGAAHSNLSAGSVTLTYVYGLRGDIDGDDEVGFNDLLTLAKNYSTTSGRVQDGDLTGDGKVDFDDLLALAQRYGTSGTDTTPLDAAAFAADWSLAQSLVPEPGLASLALIAVVARRRRD